MVNNVNIVERKYVIFVGIRTINGLLFSKGNKPTDFSKKTLPDEVIEEFVNSKILNEKYLTALVEAINSFVINYTNECDKNEITIYASSEFKACLSENDSIKFKMKIYQATGVHIFIMSPELEQLYISNLIPSLEKPYSFLRIMSTSTIIYFFDENDQMHLLRLNDIGSATIPRLLRINSNLILNIDDKISEEQTSEYIKAISQMCQPKIDNFLKEVNSKISSDLIIYLGGEIEFMQSLGYNLDKNELFNDEDHKFQISYDSFYRQSINRVFTKSQNELSNIAYNLEEAWKTGMKACTLVALSICEALKCKVIIPSNSKEFFGMYNKNFKNVVITGSRKRNYSEITEWSKHLNSRGITVESTKLDVQTEEQADRELKHLIAINNCDTLIVCNSSDNGYIGDATLFDIGYALAKGKRIIATKQPSKDVLDLIGIEIGVYEEE